MAQDRKASEGSSAAGKGQKSPIPPGKNEDLEDVSWALSTAEAMWARGDQPEALKWLRRAAEAAAEAEADDRALELAKAAAEMASLLAERAAAPPVAPPPIPSPAVTPPPLPVSTPAPVVSTPINFVGEGMDGPVTTRVPSGPPPLPASTPLPLPGSASAAPAPTTPSSGPAVSGVRPSAAAPSPPRVNALQPALPKPGQKTPSPPRVGAPPVSKRGGRRSSPSITDETTEKAGGRRASTTNETKKRRSRPPADETAPPRSTTPGGVRPDDPDQWPTSSLSGEDMDEEEQLHTRIGTPAYTESAQRASARPPGYGIPMRTSQAVRVVVWRAPDGVHVAPAGTTVTAISVEALLVALDPSADLAAWLSNK
jgi:hypothetical protein